LAEALAGQQARIIITTLQKLPVVLKQGVDLPGRRYAVIVDEAHSSQTGEASKDLELVLNSGDAEEQLSAAEAEAETNRHLPFHLYSMRHAIAEGFILDPLADYTTYQLYFQLEKAVRDDPAYDSSKAKAAIARLVMRHEHNLAQKAEVIVEHFQQHDLGVLVDRHALDEYGVL
jgi:type I restriction enzyme R subunit